MAQVVGSILITGEAQMGPYAQGLAQAARTTSRYTGAIRRDLHATSGSMARLSASSRLHTGGRGLLIAARNMDTAASRAGLLRTSILALTGVFGGITTALAVNAVMSLSDAYTSLRNQLRTVIDDEETLVAVQQKLFDISMKTRSGVKETANLYTRMIRSTKGLNLTYRELLDLTETVQKGFVIGGATPQEASSFAIQFSQALASNRLGGEELRAVLETPLGGQLAKGIGVSIGEFRKMGLQGKLTADVLIKSLQAVRAEIDEKFNRTVPTLSQSFVVLDNALTKFVGSQDQSLGASAMLSRGIIALANNLDSVANVLVALTVIMGTRFAGAAAGRMITATYSSVRAMGAMRAEAVLNARASVQAASAVRAKAAADLSMAQAAYRAAQANALLGSSTAKAGAMLTASAVQMAAANRAAASSTVALNAALAASTRTAVAGSVAMRAFSATLAFLGGPVGAAITVATLGLTYLAMRTKEADAVAQQYETSVQSLTEVEYKLASATGESAKALQKERAELIASSREQLRNTKERLENTKAIVEQALSILKYTQFLNPFDRVWSMAGNQYLQELNEGLLEVENRMVSLDALATRANPFLGDSDGNAPGLKKEESDEAKKLREAMERLRREAMVARPEFSALNKEVIDFAAGAGIAEKAIINYMHAVLAGKEATGQFAEIERLVLTKQSWEQYNSMLEKVGPTLAMVAHEQQKLNFLVQSGAITSQQAGVAFADFLTQFEDYKWIDSMSEAFSSFAGSVAQDFDNIEDHFKNLVQSISRIVSEELIEAPIRNLLRSTLSNAFGGGASSGGSGGFFSTLLAGVFHEGGIVGQTFRPRAVPAAIFNNAPRFHSGLKSNEMAAILEKGEAVLTGSDQSMLSSAMDKSFGSGGDTYNIDARGSNMTADDYRRLMDEVLRKQGKMLSGQIAEKRRRGGI